MGRRKLEKLVLALCVFAVGGCAEKEPPAPGACLHRDGKLRAGFAKFEITPQTIEGYDDDDGNGFYDTGEKQLDEDGDGKWEPVWIAGFNNGRAATGVHDPLWARTMVLERDGQVFSLTVLDLVGMLPTRMIEIRNLVKKQIGHCYDLQDADLVIATTHTHESPDTMGIWGEAIFKTGIDEDYMQFINGQAAKSIEAAFLALEPVDVKFGFATAATDINDDSRFPFVIDDDIYSAHFTRTDGSTLGSLLEYSMHPEVLWSRNTLITSDYPHYVRERMEAKLGGIAVFATGMVGGLMTPKSDVHTFEQAKYVGYALADAAIDALSAAPRLKGAQCDLRVNAKRMLLPVDNGAFQIMIKERILDAKPEDLIYDRDPMCEGVGCVELDIVAANLCGVAQFAAVPGELFPELAMGGFGRRPDCTKALRSQGVECYAGPYPDAPKETPLRKDLMTGDFRFVLGLANGEMGYIVPKSQWDTNEYEETVSLGPETAPLLLNTLEDVLAPLRQ